MDKVMLFLVRVWRPQAGGFRAHVRAVEQESACTFNSAQDLARYLDSVLSAGEADTTAAPAAQPRPPSCAN